MSSGIIGQTVRIEGQGFVQIDSVSFPYKPNADALGGTDYVFASFAKSTATKISDFGLRHRWDTAVTEGGKVFLGNGVYQSWYA